MQWAMCKWDRRNQSFEPPEEPGSVRAWQQKTTATPRWVWLREQHNGPWGERGPGDGEVPFLAFPPHHGECGRPAEEREAEDGRHPHTFRSLFLLLCQQTIASPLICESPQAAFMPLPYRFPSPSHLLCYLQLSEQSDYFSVCPATR